MLCSKCSNVLVSSFNLSSICQWKVFFLLYVALDMPILDLISHVHLPSLIIMLPKQLKYFIFSSCFGSIIIFSGDGRQRKNNYTSSGEKYTSFLNNENQTKSYRCMTTSACHLGALEEWRKKSGILNINVRQRWFVISGLQLHYQQGKSQLHRIRGYISCREGLDISD